MSESESDDRKDHVYRVTAGYKTFTRSIELRVGMTCIIDPLNPNKKKHRGRKCLILDFVPVSWQHPRDIVAKIRYLDNNRVGRAELDELAELTETESA